LNRTTRLIALTPSGEKLFAATTQMFETLNSALADIHQLQNEPSGQIVINSQSDFGEKCLIPLANQFRLKYPRVSIEISLDDQVQDLVEQHIDVSFSLGTLRDSNYHAIKLGQFDTVLCASARYAKEHSLPQILAELRQHNFIQLSVLKNPKKWTFVDQDNQKETIKLDGDISTNSSRGLQAFVRENSGIAAIPDFIIAEELKRKTLVRVLPQYSVPALGVYAVFNDRVRLPFVVRSFIEYVQKGMKSSSLFTMNK
jgi:DNA-binding transcriptional LysR family regulator